MVTSSLSFDRGEIIRALKIYHQAGDVVELRIPKAGRAKTISGYFDDFGLLADNVVGLSDDRDVMEAGGIYVTLNQIDGRLLSRSTNRYKKYAETTTADGDVIRLNWLPVDCDPHRPVGIPSSDEEHAAAIEKAEEVRAWLIGRGWPASAFVLADSGNGGHLPVKIALEPSEKNVDLVKKCLAALDFVFSDERVKIDLTTCNPARIWKLPGTVTRKGDDSEGRPHRIARLLAVPEVLGVVPRELLEDLAGILPKDEAGQKVGGDFDPVVWAEDHGLVVSKVKGWAGGILAELEECPFNSDHKRTARIGRLPSGARYFGCFHDGCKGNDWRSLRDRLEPGRGATPPPTEATTAGEGFHLGDFGTWRDVIKKIKDPVTGITEEKVSQKFELSRDKAATSFSEKMNLAMEVIGGDIHFFDGQIYRPEGAVKISDELYSIAKDYVNRFAVAEVLDRLRAKYGLKLVRFDPDPYLLGVRNGVIDLRTGEFRDYRPDDLLTDRIDVAYDPAARCPRYLKFLEEIQPNVTDRLTLVDWFPITAIKKPFPYVLFLLGLGRNGKGIYERLMKRFFGESSFSSMNLDEINRTVFAAGSLRNKRGWIASEQQGSKKRPSIGTGFVKLVSGAGAVDADMKNKARIIFEAFFQVIVDTNAMPAIDDTSIGWMERFCKQDLPYVFVDNPDPKNTLEKQKDPHLFEKLTTDEELSGILNLVIERAKAICKTEAIIKRPAADMFAEYTKQSSSLSTFWDEFCDYTPGTPSLQIPTTDVYEAYKRWCSHLVGEVVNEKYFGAYLKRQCGGISPGRKTVKDEDGNNKKVRYYPGLFFDEGKANKAIEALDSERTIQAHQSPSDTHHNPPKNNISRGIGPSGPSDLWISLIERFGDKEKISLYMEGISKNDGFDGPDGAAIDSDGSVMGEDGPGDGPSGEVVAEEGENHRQTIAEALEEDRRRQAEEVERKATPPPKCDEGRVFGLTHAYYRDLQRQTGGLSIKVLMDNQGWDRERADIAMGLLRAAGVV